MFTPSNISGMDNLDGYIDYVVDTGDTLSESLEDLEEAVWTANHPSHSSGGAIYQRVWKLVQPE